MNLFDRVKLLIRSTVGGALGGNLPELPGIGPTERSDKLLDKAQARIEILQADLARAEKRGDTELADRLRREINTLQKTLDEARGKTGQPAIGKQAPQVVNQTPSPASTPQATGEMQERKEAGDTHPDEAMDNSRVADQIRKMREGK